MGENGLWTPALLELLDFESRVMLAGKMTEEG